MGLFDWLRRLTAPPPPPRQAPPRRPAPEPGRGRWSLAPGEVVWTAVEFVDQPGVVKDRPVLIVGRERGMLIVLTLTTQQKRAGHPDWYPLGAGPWDRQRRPSWVRMHPYYRMPENGVRRSGGPVDRATFDALRLVLARDHGWTFPNG